MPVGPSYVRRLQRRAGGSGPRRRRSPVTGIGRVCGDVGEQRARASRACSTPSSLGEPQQLDARTTRQRIEGSIPCTRTTSRPAPGRRAQESRVVGQVIRRRPSSPSSTVGPVDLEVVVVLGVEPASGSAPQTSLEVLDRAVAASPASFQPSKAATMTGSRSSARPRQLAHESYPPAGGSARHQPTGADGGRPGR